MSKHTTQAIRLQVQSLQTDLQKMTTFSVIADPESAKKPALKSVEIFNHILDLIDHLSGPKHGENDD